MGRGERSGGKRACRSLRSRPGDPGEPQVCEQEGRGPRWLYQRRRSNCGSAKTQEARLCPPLVCPSLGPRVLVVREGGSWEGAGPPGPWCALLPSLAATEGFRKRAGPRCLEVGGPWWEGVGDRTEPGPGQRQREAWASNLCLPSAAPVSLSVHCLQGLPPHPPPASSSTNGHLGPLQTFLLVTTLGSASRSSRWKAGMLLSVLLHTRWAPNNRKLPTHDTRRLRGNHQ